ncbi:MAG: autotransporter-associated beta strand repeat-containing protein, partial [Candidatus Staskawiczbacteria bacterium]|nr:autotransporter-associated beta strand repeat-containing protein [Candidatus Staskawiczbacteria bacterium]
MSRGNSKKTILLLVGFILFFGCGFAGFASADTYYASGTLYSTNVLAGQAVNSVDYFGYNATIPTNTTLQVEFSQDNATWYSANHTLNTWTSLSNGNYLATNVALALSGWTPSQYFYYRVAFATTDTSVTPTLTSVQIWYGTGATYAAVSTSAASSVAGITATGNGNISSIGNSTVTERGFQYTVDSTYNSYLSVSETGTYSTGTYSLTLPNLQASSVYYVRAFVTNTEGKAYGSWQTFTTNAYYNTSGMVYSTNLLSGVTLTSIDSFYTNAVVPSGTSMSAMFSQDNATWYNAAGTLNGTPTDIPNGTNTASLSALTWTTANFYYKIVLNDSSDRSSAPTLSQANVNYSNNASYACQSTGTGNWNTAGTWTNCNSTTPQTGDTAEIMAGHTVTLDTAPTVTGVTVDATGVLATSTNGITVTGDVTANGTISGATAITVSGTSNAIYGSGTISAPVTLGATYTINVASGNLAISGIISGGYGLAKIGAGTLTLSGNNSYTDATTISAGTLAITVNNALGTNAAGTTIASGATLDVQNINYSTTEALTVNGGTIAVSTGTSTFAGAITLGDNSIVNTAGSQQLTLSGIINSGGLPFGFSNIGTGTTILSGANTFTGGLTIKAGIVQGKTSAAAFGNGIVTLGDTSGSVAATLQAGTTGLTFGNRIVLSNGTAGKLTIGNTGTAISTTFSGGVTGANNLTINSNATTGTITFSTFPVNNIGTITNIGAGTGTTTISGGVGENVTGITENSTTSALTIDTTAITVNQLGSTTLVNSAGTKLLTVSGGVNGMGNLILQNNSSTAGGITLDTTSINNTGT